MVFLSPVEAPILGGAVAKGRRGLVRKDIPPMFSHPHLWITAICGDDLQSGLLEICASVLELRILQKTKIIDLSHCQNRQLT